MTFRVGTNPRIPLQEAIGDGFLGVSPIPKVCPTAPAWGPQQVLAWVCPKKNGGHFPPPPKKNGYVVLYHSLLSIDLHYAMESAQLLGAEKNEHGLLLCG